MKLSLLLLTLVFVIAGCSESENKTKITPDPFVEQYKYLNEEFAKHVFNNSYVGCADENKCPESIGSLAIHEKTSTEFAVNFCSQTLVGEDLILTNRHCIPIDLREKNKSCAGRIKAHFPKTKTQPEVRVECAEIVDFSSDTPTEVPANGGPDWAIIRLSQKVQRTPAKLNKEGISPGAQIHLYSAYSVRLPSHQGEKENIFRQIRAQTCSSENLTDLTTVYFHRFSPVVTVESCSGWIIPGNSGSGMFSENNELLGVLSFMFNDLKEGKSKTGGGTNLGCLAPFNEQRSAFCDYQNTDYYLTEVYFLKMYTMANLEKYKISDLGYKDRSSPFVRRGPGLFFPDLPIISESQKTQLPYISHSSEIINYVSEQIQEFTFKMTASCVENNAPSSFTDIVPIMSFNNTSYYEYNQLSVVLNPIKLHFQKAGTKYLAKMKYEKVSDEDQDLYDGVQRIHDMCLSADETQRFVQCSQYETERVRVALLLKERLAPIETNVLLEGTPELTAEVPICR